MSVDIAPLVKQQFNQSGNPLAGGLLFTYAAGTTTKINTYTNAAGSTPNTNPIVLNANGECDIWLTDGVSYKLVLCPSTDTDPPTNSYWTEDNIVNTGLTVLAASSGSSLIGFLQAGSGAVARTEQSKLRDIVSVMDFGAAGDGVANDRTAFSNANATGYTIFVPPGNYQISSSITFTSNIVMLQGAKFTIPTGVTIAFNNGLTSPLQQIFVISGTGLVTFNPAKHSVGYPEWWGAVVGGSDCLNSINACIVACLVTELQAADYFTSFTISMTTAFRTLRGKGCQYTGTGTATRIVMVGGTLNILQVGPLTYPGSVNALQHENVVRDLMVTRDTAPVVPSGSSGILNIYTIYARFENVQSAESIYPFHFYGTVHTEVNICWAFRSIAGTGGTDICYGYFIDGTASIGLNGANASLYLKYSNASLGGITITNSAGFYMDKKFTDVFITNPETTGFDVGINIQGDGSSVNYMTNLDVQITNPVLDAFKEFGLFINNANKFGAIEVIGGYYGAAAGATACIYILNSTGAVTIEGGQTICTQATGCKSFISSGSSGINLKALMCIESNQSGVDILNVHDSSFAPLVKNNYLVSSTAAIVADGTCYANTYSPMVMGASSSFPYGVKLIGAGHTNSQINCTGINASTVGSSANKLLINSVAVTTQGLSGSNWVTGSMT